MEARLAFLVGDITWPPRLSLLIIPWGRHKLTVPVLGAQTWPPCPPGLHQSEYPAQSRVRLTYYDTWLVIPAREPHTDDNASHAMSIAPVRLLRRRESYTHYEHTVTHALQGTISQTRNDIRGDLARTMCTLKGESKVYTCWLQVRTTSLFKMSRSRVWMLN